jgi:hypothetical protein
MGPPGAAAVGDVAWDIVVAVGCASEVVASARLTVSGSVVIVLL